MKYDSFESMSLEDLWQLHENLAAVLSKRIEAEKAKLEARLHQIGTYGKAVSLPPDRPRRPYPPVVAKYKNPNNPADTWSGRGKRPRWLQEQLRAGKKLDRFLVAAQKRSKGN